MCDIASTSLSERPAADMSELTPAGMSDVVVAGRISRGDVTDGREVDEDVLVSCSLTTTTYNSH